MAIAAAKRRVLDSPFRDIALEIKGYITNNTTWRYNRETYSIMKKVLGKKSNCIDVGAHDGDILRRIVKYSPNGKHMAFEPIPELYQRLVKNFPRVRVYDFALSDAKGITVFQHVIDLPEYSGLKIRKYYSDK